MFSSYYVVIEWENETKQKFLVMHLPTEGSSIPTCDLFAWNVGAVFMGFLPCRQPVTQQFKMSLRRIRKHVCKVWIFGCFLSWRHLMITNDLMSCICYMHIVTAWHNVIILLYFAHVCPICLQCYIWVVNEIICWLLLMHCILYSVAYFQYLCEFFYITSATLWIQYLPCLNMVLFFTQLHVWLFEICPVYLCFNFQVMHFKSQQQSSQIKIMSCSRSLILHAPCQEKVIPYNFR